MSKRIRTLVLTGVAVLVLCGALFAVLRMPEPTEDEGDTAATTTTTAAPDALVDKTQEDASQAVASVEVTFDKQTYTIAPNAEGLMTVTEYATLPRNATALDTLCSTLTSITPLSLVREQATEEELEAFGFDAPEATGVVTYVDGTTFAFEIGTIDYGGKVNSYFRQAESETVYLISASFVSAVAQDATAYIGRTLITAPTPREDDEDGASRLTAMTLSGTLRDQTVALRYSTEEDEEKLSLQSPYTITAPYYRTSDEQITGSWETGIGTLTASDIAAVRPTAAQLAEYGLETPYSVAELTLAVCNDEETYNAVTVTVSLGGKTEDGAYYAMINGVDVVYIVEASDVLWAEYTYDELVAQFLFLEYITDIREISLTVDGTETVVALVHGTDENEEATLEATVDGKACDAAATRSLYQTLMSIQRLAPADGAQPTGTPKLVLKLTETDGSTAAEVELYAYSANRYLCRQADGDTYLVKASDVETALTQWEDYLNAAS